MKHIFNILLLSFLLVTIARADTPPPGSVNAKMYSGDGTTAIGHTGAAINVNVTGGSGLTSTVNQGTAGASAWLESVTSSVLPTNACQETGGNLASILSKLNSSIAVTGTFWQATQPVSGTFWQTTQPVSVASLPLPSGAATAAKQPALGVAGTPSSDVISVQGITSMTALKVDGSAVTQPVSGTFWQTTQPVSIASIPIATGAATSALQTTGNTSLASLVTNLGSPFQAGGSIGNSSFGISGSLPAFASTPTFNLGTLNGAATAAKQPALGTAGSASSDVISVQGIASMTALKVDGSGVTQPVSGTFWQATQPVSASSLPLPTGAATSSLQTTGNTSLSSIDGKTPALGQALSAASVPVVLPAAQITTLTPLSSVTVTQGTGSNLHVAVDSAPTTAVTGTFWQATQPVSGTFWQATQPVSIATAPALVASSAVIGKVGIDQTTPGTTNLVVAQAGTPTALTIHQATVTIGTSAVQLTYNGSAPAATRVLLVAQLDSASTANCYFGSSSVTASSTTQGVQMFPGQTVSFTNDAGAYYAICNTTSQSFHITEQE